MITFMDHSFNQISIDNSFIYRCEKCNIKVWHNAMIPEFSGIFYYKLSEEIQYNIVLNLSCAEVIIKNIIE